MIIMAKARGDAASPPGLVLVAQLQKAFGEEPIPEPNF